jgi:peptidoglycan/LPS O-acetylase OafA/YrhL
MINKGKIDLLLMVRGLLAVSVIVWHVTGYRGTMPSVLNIPGRTAVWIFFGISGYVISFGFIKARYKLIKSDMKDYYINRFLRIYPLFLTISLIAFLTEYFVIANYPITLSDIPSNILMLQFNHSYILSGVFWTLGVEVNFYMIAPLLSLILLRDYNYQVIILACVYFAMIAWIGMSFYFFGWSLDGRNILSNLSHFFIGMIGCKLISTNNVLKFNKIHLTVAIVFLIGLSNIIYHSYPSLYLSAGNVLIDLIILLLIILHNILEEKNLNRTNYLLQFITYLGTISYGIYAWHAYLIKYISYLSNNVIWAIATSILVSYLSYKFIELPALRLKRHSQNKILK